MFVVADVEPSEGDVLEFEIDLGLDEETPLVVVRGEGRVVRIERLSLQSTGFAVHNLWFRLSEPEQGQVLPPDFATLAVAMRSPQDTGKTVRNRGLAIVPREVVTDSDPGESK